MHNPSPLPSDRSVGLLFTAVASVASIWLFVLNHRAAASIALVTAAGFAITSLVRPAVLHPLNVAWMKFAEILNRIVSPIVLGIMFFGVITPVAWVTRRFGRDALRMRRVPGAHSYWLPRDPPGPDRSGFPRQY